MQQLIAAVLGITVVCGLSIMRWRAAGKAILYIVVLEGALRKWLFPGLSSQIYFAKDAVLLGAFIGMVANGGIRAKTFPVALTGLMAALTVYTGINAFNPAMDSVVVGIMGVKAYVLWALYPPLLGALFTTQDEINRYLRGVFLTTIPICALAMLQFTLPGDHILNVYAREAEINTFGSDIGNVRVTGTFPFLTGLGYYLVFVTVFLLPTIVILEDRFTQRLQVVLLPMIMIAGFMTGSRTTVFFIWLLAFGTLVGLVLVVNVSVAKLRWFFLGVAACVAMASVQFAESWNAWSARVAGTQADGVDTVASRLVAPFLQAADPEVFSLIGDGTGSTNNAAMALGELLQMPVKSPVRPVEDEIGRVMADLGVAGALLWYSFKITVMLVAVQRTRQLRDSYLRGIALAITVFLFICVLRPVVLDPSLCAFYWFTVGIVLLLPRLERVRLPLARTWPAMPPGPALPMSRRIPPGR